MDKIRNNKGQFMKGSQNRTHIPIIGIIYGELIVISEKIEFSCRDTHVKFHVKCSCGKELFVRAGFLKSGRQNSCKSCGSKRIYAEAKKNGTRTGFLMEGHHGVGDISKTVYGVNRRRAKKAGWEWSVSIEFLWELYIRQNRKCALSGLDIWFTSKRKKSNIDWSLMNASLDRIDSSKGYTEGNVQWTHKEYNRFKNNYSMRDFKDMCIKVSNNKKYGI